MQILKKTLYILFKTVASVVMIAMMAVFATSVSPVYTFEGPKPFSGPHIYDPYSDFVPENGWKRANFHTHTRVESIFNECEYWPAEVYEAYRKFGYDIISFSNHNRLTEHPSDPELQINVYEHGYNLFKYHKLVFGSRRVNRFDHLLPIFTFQKQFQLDLLGKDCDFIQLNHPLRTIGTSKKQMQRLKGYRLMELDSGRSTENEYWDWALSAGHYCLGLANDDLHYPDRTSRIAVRCSFINSFDETYQEIGRTLLEGCHYSMRIPDYGNGDWDVKYSENQALPAIYDIGLDDDVIYMVLSEKADSIKVTGQDHACLATATDTDRIEYTMKPEDSYARLTAWFPDGEVIYTNPFARYDGAISDGPFESPGYSINILLTVLWNLLLLMLLAGTATLLVKTIRK